VKSPLYDPLDWVFTKRNSEDPTSFSNSAFELKYLRNESEFHVFKVLGYKDSNLFFGTLTILSLILGIILIANTCIS
jgi:hypothetical protein